MMFLIASYCAVLFPPRDVLDESWDLTESVSRGFPTYSYIYSFQTFQAFQHFCQEYAEPNSRCAADLFMYCQL